MTDLTQDAREAEKRCMNCGDMYPGDGGERCSACARWNDPHRGFTSRNGGVYFVRSGAFIKIGMANNVRRRIEAGLIWNPHEFTPLGWIPRPLEDDAYAFEHRLHVKFAALRHRGEWFKAEEPLLAFIEKYAKPWPAKFGVS